MENASKALIMAGGVLISVLLASFMIMILRKAGSMSAEYDSQATANELVKFNSQFEAYVKTDNTFFDVITAANLAYDINKKNGNDSSNGVEVFLYKNKAMKDSDIEYSVLNRPDLAKNFFFEGKNTNKSKYIYSEIISTYADTKEDVTTTTEYQYYFEGNAEYSDVTGKVNKMNFIIVENN